MWREEWESILRYGHAGVGRGPRVATDVVTANKRLYSVPWPVGVCLCYLTVKAKAKILPHIHILCYNDKAALVIKKREHTRRQQSDKTGIDNSQSGNWLVHRPR